MKCDLCFHHCEIAEGKDGFCKARGCVNGSIVPLQYGKVTSIALDAIEKKPFAHFHPGSKILSIGSSGCNFHCDFCQNYTISQEPEPEFERVTPEDIVFLGEDMKQQGNIGIAYTYNEPLIGYEFVYDCARLAHDHQLKNVVVTNGAISSNYLLDLLPYIDAMNIDLKSMQPKFYQDIQGNLEQVKQTIVISSPYTHVELTTLIIPGRNDSIRDMEEEAAWIASIDPDIPLHLTRYFPAYQCKIAPTNVDTLKELYGIARKYLNFVYLGNC